MEVVTVERRELSDFDVSLLELSERINGDQGASSGTLDMILNFLRQPFIVIEGQSLHTSNEIAALKRKLTTTDGFLRIPAVLPGDPVHLTRDPNYVVSILQLKEAAQRLLTRVGNNRAKYGDIVFEGKAIFEIVHDAVGGSSSEQPTASGEAEEGERNLL
jgi:hypothetical protein